MTFAEFKSPFYAFCETFNRKMSNDALKVWFAAFSDIPAKEFSGAVTRFIREAQSGDFPTPGEIRKYCPSAMSDEDRARTAWEIAVRTHASVGYQRSVDFDDRIINAVVRRMGGWEAFRDWPPEDTKFREIEFRKHYMTIARTGVGDGSPLLGMTDRVNGLDAPQREMPRLISTGIAAHPVAKRLSYNEPRQKRLFDAGTLLIGETA